MSVNPDEAVIFDVNVYLDYIFGDDGAWPLLPTPPPPASGNPSADAVALAFDNRFRLFTSPHILRNIRRVMITVGVDENICDSFIAAIVDVCEFSGGGTVDPHVTDAGTGDYEDSAILALARDPGVDARVIVSSDFDLIKLGPLWHGRLILRPVDFVRSAM